MGTHHQNGVAERYIRTFVERARNVLLNAHARWPDTIDMEVWTFALRHVVTQWNNPPRAELQWLTPDEKFNNFTRKTKSVKQHFKHFHPFGCPAYVLDDNLQDGKSHPKWKPRTKVGVYLGRSKHHASNVSLILNPKTDHISAQYHVIFDDDFHTVTSASEDDEIEVWKGLYKTYPKLGIINQFEQEDKISFDGPQMNVMDLASIGAATPVVSQLHSTNPRTQAHNNTENKNKNNRINKSALINNTNNSSRSDGTHVVRDQLITGTETVP